MGTIKFKRLVYLIISALILTSVAIPNAYAKAKAPKLSAKKVSIAVGASKKVKVKNAPSKAKAKWKSKNVKIAKVNKKGKITGVSAGSTKVICTLKYKSGKKSVTKKLNVKVTVTAANTTTTAPQATQVAAVSTKPAVATVAPAAPTNAAPATVAPATATPAGDASAEPEATVVPTPDADYMDWWKDAKFGMFIHFGSYSEYGMGEWAMSMYKIDKETYQSTISAKFNPTEFDAEAIASAADNAGMKYLVITSKHHEGFSMWDTQVEGFKDYTGTKQYSLQDYTEFGDTGRDILMELKEACEKHGIKFGLYYSILDWNHSSQTIGTNFTDMASWKDRIAYINDMKAQLKELVDTYDPAILWFDGDWTGNETKDENTLTAWWSAEDGQELWDYLRSLNKNIIVNERLCRGFDLGDFDCPEDKVPVLNAVPDRLWETCRTMNGAWGYNEARSASDYYTADYKLINEFVQAVSRHGNYLLNVGPNGQGLLSEGDTSVLNAFGEWMKVNGESIYGTTANPFGEEQKWGTYTQKDNTLYAHVLNWPSDNTITVSKLDSKTLKSATVLGSEETVSFEDDGESIKVTLPESAKSDADTVVKLTFE